MKIEFSLEADTAAELLTALQNFVHADGVGEKKTVKKSTDKEPEEDKPKKTTKKSDGEESEDRPLTHEDARAAIISLSKKLDWDPAPPKINAFTKKFAKKHDITDDAGDLIERIPQIPVKKLKAFIEAVKEAEAEGEI